METFKIEAAIKHACYSVKKWDMHEHKNRPTELLSVLKINQVRLAFQNVIDNSKAIFLRLHIPTAEINFTSFSSPDFFGKLSGLFSCFHNQFAALNFHN